MILSSEQYSRRIISFVCSSVRIKREKKGNSLPGKIKSKLHGKRGAEVTTSGLRTDMSFRWRQNSRSLAAILFVVITVYVNKLVVCMTMKENEGRGKKVEGKKRMKDRSEEERKQEGTEARKRKIIITD